MVKLGDTELLIGEVGLEKTEHVASVSEETKFIIDEDAAQHVVHVNARALSFICVVSGSNVGKANCKSDGLIMGVVDDLIVVGEDDRVLVIGLLGNLGLHSVIVDVGATSREDNRLVAIHSGVSGVNVKINGELLEVFASDTSVVPGLVLLDLGDVLVDNDLSVLEMQLVVLDSCLKLYHSGAIGHYTVVHGIQDIAPNTLGEVVIVGVCHGVDNFRGLDRQLQRGTDHHVLSRIGLECEGVVRERKEHRLVECSHV